MMDEEMMTLNLVGDEVVHVPESSAVEKGPETTTKYVVAFEDGVPSEFKFEDFIESTREGDRVTIRFKRCTIAPSKIYQVMDLHHVDVLEACELMYNRVVHADREVLSRLEDALDDVFYDVDDTNALLQRIPSIMKEDNAELLLYEELRKYGPTSNIDAEYAHRKWLDFKKCTHRNGSIICA